MSRLLVSSVVLIILNSVISVLANVKITPIAVDNLKSNLKSDLKVEEARYRDPIVPEYYGNSYDRNRQNFVTSNYGSYGDGISNYDRYGTNSGYNSAMDKYGSNYDRYGSQWNKDRTGLNFGANPLNPIEKTNYMPGGVYNPSSGSGLGVNYGNYGNSYGSSYGGGSYGGGSYGGNRNPYPLGGGSINGPYPGTGMGMGGLHGGLQGLFPQDLEGKSSLILPIAGAALLGIAAYALVSNPGIAMGGSMMGKRRKRSLFDDKLEQHLVYRAHQNRVKKTVK